jgi:cytochrome P450
MSTSTFDPDLTEFWRDPYPALKRLRAEAPVIRAAFDGNWVLTRHEDIISCLLNPEVFSSDQYDAVTRIQGRGFMRMDGDEHRQLRNVVLPTFSPKAAKTVWRNKFEHLTEEVLDRVEPLGEADWIKEVAMPIAAEALKLVTGLTQISWQEMDRLSQGMIDGAANVTKDKAVAERCNDCTSAIDKYLDEIIPQAKASASNTLISSMLQKNQPIEQIRADLKITIGGGQNEPRDVIAGATDQLLANPEQLAKVKNGEATWRNAFDEYVRLVAPIGAVTRQLKTAYELRGVRFEPKDTVVMFVCSANHDESIFDAPEKFDVMRDTSNLLSFSKGAHFCGGAHVSRTLIADVALPMIFERFKNLRLIEETVYGGIFFRGPIKMRVAWDAA